jgi:hypothetical protein
MTAMPMESAASPVLVKLAPVAAATAMANRPSADVTMTAGRRVLTAWTSTAIAPSPSSRPSTACVLSAAGPRAMAVARPEPWSARGTVA